MYLIIKILNNIKKQCDYDKLDDIFTNDKSFIIVTI